MHNQDIKFIKVLKISSGIKPKIVKEGETIGKFAAAQIINVQQSAMGGNLPLSLLPQGEKNLN